MKKNFKVIVEASPRNRPRDYELSAALLLANHFQCNIKFLRPIPMKSPDLSIKGKKWELKSPTGRSKNTISNNFKNARKQSSNIVIDLRRCKLHENNAISRIREAIHKRKKKDGKVLVITKDQTILEFSNEMRYYKNNRR